MTLPALTLKQFRRAIASHSPDRPIDYAAGKSAEDDRGGVNAVMRIGHIRPRRDAYRQTARLWAIFLLIALLPGWGSAHAGSIEGYWYGNGYQPAVRKTMQWLTNNRLDGSFSVEFREYDNCRLVSAQTETGKWSVAGGIVTKKTLTANGKLVNNSHYYTDTYKIIEFDDLKMRIVHQKSGQEWTLERVTEKFTFPDCKPVS